VLVVKQKGPVRLIEFGPTGPRETAWGAARFLRPQEPFDVEQGMRGAYEPLESRGIDVGRYGPLKSINDAVVADDTLYLISRASGRSARLDADVAPSDGSVRVEVSGLRKDIAQPEGLVLLDGLVPIVADDQPKNGRARDNVFPLRPLGPRVT
jgi:hypothetical protein